MTFRRILDDFDAVVLIISTRPLIFKSFLVLFVLFLVAVLSLPLRSLYSLQDVLSRYRRYLQFWWVLFLLLFLIHTICLRYHWDVRVYASTWVFFLYGPFLKVFSLVCFMNNSEYHTRGTTRVFIPWMRFLLYSLVSSNFFVLQRYFFRSPEEFFLSSPLVW